MTWHTDRMCGFDLETTGVDVETDRIVTACVVQCGGGQPTASATWLANPGVEIPAGAAAIHGITTAQAQAEGDPAAEVVEQLVAALAQAQRDSIPIVAMNARFDLTILDREARRHGITPLVDIIGSDDLRVIDPMVIDKQMSRRRGKRTLVDLCEFYRVPIGDAHTADADAIAACRVAWALHQRYAQLQRADVRGLHLLQIGWAADQASSFRAYLRGRQEWDRAKTVHGEWPWIPVDAPEPEAEGATA